MAAYYPLFATLTLTPERATLFAIACDTNSTPAVYAWLVLAGFASMAGSDSWARGHVRAVVYVGGLRASGAVLINISVPPKLVSQGGGGSNAHRGVAHEHVPAFWARKLLAISVQYTPPGMKTKYYATLTGEVYTRLGARSRAAIWRKKFLVSIGMEDDEGEEMARVEEDYHSNSSAAGSDSDTLPELVDVESDGEDQWGP